MILRAGLIEVYLAELAERPLAARTLSDYRANLTAFREHLGEASCTLERLADYRQWLEQFTPATRAERSRQVRCFLRWGHAEGHWHRDLAAGWTLTKQRAQAWIPAPDQVLALLAAPADTKLGQRDQVVLEILYGAGLRRSECSALDVRDWDRELSCLWVRQSKGQKDRLQPVGESLAIRIDTYVTKVRPELRPAPEETALLLTRSGRRLAHYNVAELVRRYRRQLELPKLTVHSLRRAYANHMLQNGAAIHHLQQLLSHQSPETTMHYTQTSLEDLREEHGRFHPRARARARRL
ncbi:MAG: tyrosine-type recombinase/integrase [Candidatus Eremiobacteraeota bacterium]|nr:tyrosine-type recombinase/integrase [Candidatus Eremiobacteraeota bacterium]MCW5866553.1 tyrosine-type recombinase/integrase [Candidatus Eremiobacteraeota bacterium]